MRAFWRVGLPLLGSIILVAGGGTFWPRTETASRAEAIAWLDQSLPLEGWLTGINEPILQGQSRPGHERLARSRTDAYIKVHNEPSVGLAIDAALLSLVERDWRSIELLLNSAGGDAKTAAELSDLSVLHLARWRDQDDPESLLAAFDLIERAIHLDASFRQALFNRALILESLGIHRGAYRAWSRYLALDDNSIWSKQAREHLARLKTSAEDALWTEQKLLLRQAVLSGDTESAGTIVRRFPQQSREYLEMEILPEWGRWVEDGHEAEAAEVELLAEGLSRHLSQVTGDLLAFETVAALRAGGQWARGRIARGHRRFATAYRLLKQGRTREAKQEFVGAREELELGGSPFRGWASFYEAVCDHRDDSSEEALRRAKEVAQAAQVETYSSLAAMAQWLRGLILLERADPYQALDPLRQALGYFRSAQEESNKASVLSLLANCLEYLGEESEAWRYRHAALQATLAGTDAARVPVIYGSTARALLRRNKISAALAFQNEALQFALELGDARAIAEAFWWRAMIFNKAGENHRAARDIDMALEYCRRIKHEPTRLRTLAGISVTQGAILRAIDLKRGVEVLSRALELYRNAGYDYLLRDLYLERARCFLALGNYSATEEDYEAGLSEYERQREKMGEPQVRASFFERAETLVDEMIAFQVDRKQSPDEAFAVAERSRARMLLDLIADHHKVSRSESTLRPLRPVTTSAVRKQIPNEMAYVQFFVLPDRVLVWRFGLGNDAFVQVPVRRNELRKMVKELRNILESGQGDQEIRTLGGRVYELLLGEVLADVPRHTPVLIIPDKELAFLPFPGLWVPRQSAFLIELYPIALSPSASIYLELLKRSDSLRKTSPSPALIVGNPAFDRGTYQDLPSLPGAEAEARQVAEDIEGSILLVGSRASRASLLPHLKRSRLFHFAGHAWADRLEPSRSRLILANSGSGHDDLMVEEIQKLDLSHLQLVVLSACNTASGKASSLEGISSLDVAFLSAGATAVLASSWEVEDGAANQLFDSFYAGLESGLRPMAALRNAQVAMINSSMSALRHPQFWAGFRLTGGVSLPDTP